MKKPIIFLFILFFSKLDFVYGDIWMDEIKNTNEYKIIETEKRYLWYKENYQDIGYINNPTNEYNVDRNDFKIEYSDWTKYNSEDIENIEIRKWYNYSKIIPLKEIEFSNAFKNIKILEIEIYYKGEKISFGSGCAQCTSGEPAYIIDGIIDINKAFNLERRGRLVLRLDKEYPLEDLEIKVILASSNTNENLDIIFSDFPYTYKNTIRKNYKIKDDNIKEMNFKIDDTWTFNTKYYEPIKTDKFIKETWHTKVNVEQEYRIINKLYHCYKIKKEYVDGYFKDNPKILFGLKKDKENYKIFYKYEPLFKKIDNDIFNTINEQYIPIKTNKMKYTVKDTTTDVNDILKEEKPTTIYKNQKRTNKIKSNNIKKTYYAISILLIIGIIIFINKKHNKFVERIK